MKAKAASLLVVLLIATTQLMAQKRITVEATSNDISYNLDLRAVASIFGESRDLEEFEMKLNDYDSGISNLDLNDDGEVDYLRVIETYEKNVHVVVIQAVLDRDIFQDVATIVVERKSNRTAIVQIIGDPYMYGVNYIIEPIYYHRPTIFSYLWARRYRSWVSPYYWGYYPNYYRYRRPYEVNIYLNNVYTRINHRHNYRYTDTRRNDYSVKLQSQISRNDYSRKHPERNFSTRNENVRNKHDFQTNRPDNNRTGTRPNVQNNESERRSYESVRRNDGNPASTRPTEGTRREGTRMNERNPGQQNNAPATSPRNPAATQTRPSTNTNNGTYQSRPSTNTNSGTQTRPSTNNNSGTYQSRPSTNTNSGTYQSRPSTNSNRETNQVRPSTPSTQSRPAPSVTRETPARTSTPSVSQPTRSSEPRQVERKPAESSRSNDSKSDTKTETRSSSSSNRR